MLLIRCFKQKKKISFVLVFKKIMHHLFYAMVNKIILTTDSILYIFFKLNNFINVTWMRINFIYHIHNCGNNYKKISMYS